MSVSTNGSQPTRRSSWSHRLFGAFAVATLSLVLTQGFSPPRALGDSTGPAEAGSIEADLGVGLAGILPSASAAAVCQEEGACQEGKECRGKIQCNWGECKDCFKKDPLDRPVFS